jgi:drug/metabolite transporter (DMT)-like permease
MTILLVILTNLFMAASSLFFKLAIDKVGRLDLTSFAALWPVAVRLAISPLFILGFSAGTVGSICYYLMLARMNVSVAYPLLSIAYVFVAFASVLFLNETIGLPNWLGIGFICLGVALISFKVA